jgi:hypothetical protein
LIVPQESEINSSFEQPSSVPSTSPGRGRRGRPRGPSAKTRGTAPTPPADPSPSPGRLNSTAETTAETGSDDLDTSQDSQRSRSLRRNTRKSYLEDDVDVDQFADVEDAGDKRNDVSTSRDSESSDGEEKEKEDGDSIVKKPLSVSTFKAALLSKRSSRVSRRETSKVLDSSIDTSFEEDAVATVAKYAAKMQTLVEKVPEKSTVELEKKKPVSVAKSSLKAALLTKRSFLSEDDDSDDEVVPPRKRLVIDEKEEPSVAEERIKSPSPSVRSVPEVKKTVNLSEDDDEEEDRPLRASSPLPTEKLREETLDEVSSMDDLNLPEPFEVPEERRKTPPRRRTPVREVAKQRQSPVKEVKSRQEPPKKATRGQHEPVDELSSALKFLTDNNSSDIWSSSPPASPSKMDVSTGSSSASGELYSVSLTFT